MSLGVGGIVSLGGSSGGAGGGSSSGVQVINPGNNTGPTITFQGVNGVQVTSPSLNNILIDGAGASGVGGSSTKFAQSFTAITSGLFTHNLGTMDVIVQVYTSDSPRLQLFVDQIRIENSNQVSMLCNRPQSGRIIVLG